MEAIRLSPEDTVAAVWRALFAGQPEGASERALRDVLDRYAEPHRHWHTLRHVSEMLAFVAAHPGGGHPAQMLDVIFHDVMYDPRSKTNEEDSYWLREEVLRQFGPLYEGAPAQRRVRGVDPPDSDDTILATRTHRSSDPRTQVVLDADLEVLSRPWKEYRDYAARIRREYAHVSDEDFRAGRAAFMRAFLQRPALYFTAPMQEREPLARANLAREIALLESGGIPGV